tara:strand:- start:303 stop:479 length:177 start_codon:yes stop_codon:yes gene_type:complete
MREISALNHLNTMTEPDTQTFIPAEDSMASTSSDSLPYLSSKSTSDREALIQKTGLKK